MISGRASLFSRTSWAKAAGCGNSVSTKICPRSRLKHRECCNNKKMKLNTNIRLKTSCKIFAKIVAILDCLYWREAMVRFQVILICLFFFFSGASASPSFDLFFKNISQMSQDKRIDILSKRLVVESRRGNSSFPKQLLAYLLGTSDFRGELVPLFRKNISTLKTEELLSSFDDKSMKRFINILRARSAQKTVETLFMILQSKLSKDIPLLKEKGGMSELIWVENGLGLSQASQFKYETAIKSYRRAIQYAKTSKDKISEMWTRVSLLELFRDQGKVAALLEEAGSMEALASEYSMENPFLAWANFYRAQALGLQGNVSGALELNLKSLTMFKESKIDEDHMISVLYGTSILKRYAKRNDDSLRDIDSAISFFKKHRTSKGNGIFSLYLEKVRIYLSKGEGLRARGLLKDLEFSIKGTETESLLRPLYAFYREASATKVSSARLKSLFNKVYEVIKLDTHIELLEAKKLLSFSESP